MKGAKCFLYYFILSLAVLVSSWVIFSHDASAIQYTVDSIMVHPFGFPGYNTGSLLSQSQLEIDLIDTVSNLDIEPRATSYLRSQYDSTSQKCKWPSTGSGYNNPGYSISGSSFQSIIWEGSFLAPWSFPDFTLTPEVMCKSMYQYGYHYEDISVPDYDSSTVPFNSQLNVSSMLPYNYMFNTIRFSNSRTIDNIEYETNFDISELLQNTRHLGDEDFVYYTDKISRVYLPLNFDASLASFGSGDNISLAGRIDFGSGLTDSEVSSLSAQIYIQYYNSTSVQGFILPCSLHYYQNYSLNSLAYYCSGSVPEGVIMNQGWYAFTFHFGHLSLSDNTPITSTAQSMTFSPMTFTFYNDPDTYGGSGSVNSNGSFPNVAPGIAQADPNDVNWFQSLNNLFGFNFANPFAPLFIMFTDNSGCASIPTLAGMLHSTETTYCPWFSSDVRNILTPVLGISSMMLIFGFAVRWLSSSSGNMFEDQTTHKWGNTQFKSKGVK